jgi:beta-glucosidase
MKSQLPTYTDGSQSIPTRVDALIGEMTLEEKVAQLGSCWPRSLVGTGGLDHQKMRQVLGHGIGQITRIAGSLNEPPEVAASIGNAIQRFLVEETRLGIPALIHDECLTSFMTKKATVFPQMIGIAAAWDPAAVRRMAGIIREQMVSTGTRQGLAPVLDIVHDARWGRTGETFGEDPYLVSRLGMAYVKGLQGRDLKQGVIATAKHYLAYGASEGGMNWAPAHVGERELYEVYARPFEAAIREANLGSVMASYNEIDGVPVGSSREILTKLLRERLGFSGFVVADYQTVFELYHYHHVAATLLEAGVMAIQAGLDVELPEVEGYGMLLVDAARRGLVEQQLIDNAVRRHLAAKFRLGLFEQPFVSERHISSVFSNPKHKSTARRIAGRTMTLLKNDGLLPLSKAIASLAVIGPSANSLRNFFGSFDYIGRTEGIAYMIAQTAGSHTISSRREEILKTGALQRFKEFIDQKDIDAVCRKYYDMVSFLEAVREKVSSRTKVHYAEGCDVTGTRTDGFRDAIAAAQKSELAIVVVGERCGMTDTCTSGEGKDRSNLDLPGVQQLLLEAVYSTNTPIVLVLVNDRPLSIAWACEHVPAILEAWMPGEQGPRAIADVLFGDVTPGGKLPISVPRSVGQLPLCYNHKPSGGRTHWWVDYADGSAKPLFPFGHGLSYTEFRYENLKIIPDEVDSRGRVEISVEVTNAGRRRGDEVVQLYLHDREANVTRPVKQLVGFKRLPLKPGEMATVTFRIRMSQLGFMDRALNFIVEPGHFDVMVGSSSEDIRLRGEFTVMGEAVDLRGGGTFGTEPVVVM